MLGHRDEDEAFKTGGVDLVRSNDPVNSKVAQCEIKSNKMHRACVSAPSYSLLLLKSLYCMARRDYGKAAKSSRSIVEYLDKKISLT